ncbi:MAG TPA: cytochrome P450 [Solirubrobacteraceae bacterium]|nr:cytochrome P450 [Solirubrobacteraceae bacterium]
MASAAQLNDRELGSPAPVPDGPPATPPGPSLPALAQTLAWTLAPTWLMEQCARRLGSAFTITFAPSGRQFVFVSDPEAVKDVMTAPGDVAPSAAAQSPLVPIMGHNSVIVLTGPEHMRQRKLLLPPFHGERMREYESTIVAATRQEMAGWTLGRPMRVHPATRRITLDVILSAIFGVDAERMDPLRRAIGNLLGPGQTVMLLRVALSGPDFDTPPRALADALAQLDRLVYAEIALRREQPDLSERTDILSLLLQARDEDGQPMSDRELRDELVTLLLAGHETTATSVAWAIERLVRHPDKLERLLDEIDEGGEEYLEATVNEILRIRPVVPIVVRVLEQELAVGGRLLPAGTRVAPCIYLTNRNPDVYEQPLAFRPERFLGRNPDTFAWIPFGGGIRRCIGAAFAQLEMKLMLRTMLAELHPRPAGGRLWRNGEWTRRRAITFAPGAGAKVVWERRGNGRSAG